ncbi:hypothetical protein BDW71DRAFT_96403 [Aspergillus fruticulosus]
MSVKSRTQPAEATFQKLTRPRARDFYFPTVHWGKKKSLSLPSARIAETHDQDQVGPRAIGSQCLTGRHIHGNESLAPRAICHPSFTQRASTRGWRISPNNVSARCLSSTDSYYGRQTTDVNFTLLHSSSAMGASIDPCILCREHNSICLLFLDIRHLPTD